MTDPNKTAIAIILDASGSMEVCKPATIAGVNAFLREQSKLPGDVRGTLTLFSGVVDMPWVDMPLATFPPISNDNYACAGGTRLYDAIGYTIDSLGKKFADLPEHERPGMVVVAIVTDGEENSSKVYALDAIREKVKHQTEKYAWVFQYIGANQDAVLNGQHIGIQAANSITYNVANTSATYAALGASITRGRTALLSGQSLNAAASAMGWTDDERSKSVAP